MSTRDEVAVATREHTRALPNRSGRTRHVTRPRYHDEFLEQVLRTEHGSRLRPASEDPPREVRRGLG